MWTQCMSVTDGRTDGQTNGQTDRITITKVKMMLVGDGGLMVPAVYTINGSIGMLHNL